MTAALQQFILTKLQGDPKSLQGKLLRFTPKGFSMGRAKYDVHSVRGGFWMGTVEWSNQWHAPKFVSAPEATFDKTCVAELYAAMRDLK